MKFDLLVAGDGLAALSLLLHLPESTKVGVISRGSHTESASYNAQGGISAVFSPDDDIEKHRTKDVNSSHTIFPTLSR